LLETLKMAKTGQISRSNTGLAREISQELACKTVPKPRSFSMHIVKRVRMLFYSLAFVELILLTAYQAWGKAIVR